VSGRLVAVALVLIGIGASLVLWSFRMPQPSAPVSLVLSGPGRITDSRLSPDGRQLLYTLEQPGEKPKNLAEKRRHHGASPGDSPTIPTRALPKR
jgi:hypothetical protein